MNTVVIQVKDRKGRNTSIDAPLGVSLMTVLKANGLPVAAICSGSKSCATCHVWISKGYEVIGLPDEDEVDLLSESDHFKEGASRLSCQIMLSNNFESIDLELAPQD